MPPSSSTPPTLFTAIHMMRMGTGLGLLCIKTGGIKTSQRWIRELLWIITGKHQLKIAT
jgi:hypothetical protein